MQFTPEEVCRRLLKLEQLVQLLLSRIERETGEELLEQIMPLGMVPMFGPTRAEKEAFEKSRHNEA